MMDRVGHEQLCAGEGRHTDSDPKEKVAQRAETIRRGAHQGTDHFAVERDELDPMVVFIRHAQPGHIGLSHGGRNLVFRSWTFAGHEYMCERIRVHGDEQ